MDLSAVVLGKSVADGLRARQQAAVLRIGRDQFTRAELAHVECFNFMAAQNLSAILNRELNVKSVADVFERVSPQDLALPRLGAVSLAVLGAAFEAKGLGGTTPLETWVRAHSDKDSKLVTFTSFKSRDDHATERKAAKVRKQARRDRAHRIRTDRFLARHPSDAKE